MSEGSRSTPARTYLSLPATERNARQLISIRLYCGRRDLAGAPTATLPKGWKGRLVNLPDGDTEGVRGLCLDPHDLAIAKYVARREKNILFTRELAGRGIVSHDRLLVLLEQTPVSEETRQRIRANIAGDFAAEKILDGSRRDQIDDDTSE